MKKILSSFMALVLALSSLVFCVTTFNANDSSALPSKYDPRTLGIETAVKNQYSTNNCWAYATMSASESNIIKRGLYTGDPSGLNLSGSKYAYSLFKRSDDPLGNSTGDLNTASGSYTDSAVSYNSSQAFHLSTWISPTEENSSADVLDYSDVKYKLKDSIFYSKPSVETVKQAIAEYGAVLVGIYASGGLYYSTYYYTTSSRVDHDVCIVGWDDSISKSKFSPSPSSDGAWIVKNSWGASDQDGGYFYLSYESSISSVTAFDYMSADEYDYNYFYDGSCSAVTTDTIYMGGTTSAESAGNIFIAQKSTDEQAEYVKGVSVALNTTSSEVQCEVQVYTNIEDETNPQSGTLSATKTVLKQNSGVYTIELDNPVEVEAGTKFSVVANLTALDGGTVSMYISRDKSSIGGGTTTDVGQPNQSFISRPNDANGQWEDLYNFYKLPTKVSTARLKALTVVSALDHTHTGAQAVEENRVEPNCTTAGSYDLVVYCKDCNTELSRDNVTIKAIGHTLPKEAYNVEDLTETDGHIHSYFKCTVCGEDVESLEHVEWIDGYYTTEETISAGCLVQGRTTYTCTVCDTTKTENTPALGHKYVATGTVTTNAIFYRCEYCNLTTTQKPADVFAMWDNTFLFAQINRTATDNSSYLDVNSDGCINAKDYALMKNLAKTAEQSQSETGTEESTPSEEE